MRKRRLFGRGMLTILAGVFAFLFLLPTLLTITNSFMTQSEISSNYGQVFQNASDGRQYVSEKINLKFIPDQVTFMQYITVLLRSPDYLLLYHATFLSQVNLHQYLFEQISSILQLPLLNVVQ